MVWTEITNGSANWVSQEGFGNYLYGEVLYGQHESSNLWITTSSSSAFWRVDNGLGADFLGE